MKLKEMVKGSYYYNERYDMINDSYIERKYIVNEFDKQVGNVY